MMLLTSLILCASALAAPPSQASGEMPLWPGKPPGALGDKPEDIPTLTRFDPPSGTANGASILVLPGGGYAHLAGHEGEGYARWLAAHGITCYVLKYRLGSAGYHHPVMLQDAARALRTVRATARKDGLDPNRIGVIGSSAGGHLAATLLTKFDAGTPGDADPVETESSRPDVGILCYAVITMGEFTHGGSKRNLLGADASAELAGQLSAERNVTPQTPPCFIWHTDEDPAVPVENAFLFATALRKAKVPFELHVFEKGGHGLGAPATNKNAPPWDELCLRWLRQRGFIP